MVAAGRRAGWVRHTSGRAYVVRYLGDAEWSDRLSSRWCSRDVGEAGSGGGTTGSSSESVGEAAAGSMDSTVVSADRQAQHPSAAVSESARRQTAAEWRQAAWAGDKGSPRGRQSLVSRVALVN